MFTKQDMDLIEVLWKQDVDLGFSMENAVHKSDKDADIKIIDPNDPTTSINGKHDDLEKIKTLQAINKESVKEEPEEIDDPWAGLDYTIDTETGEYVIKGELSLSGVDCSSSSCDLPLGDLSLPLPEFLLDEALRLVDLEDETSQENAINLKELENLSLEAAATCGDADELASGSEEAAARPDEREPDFDFLDDMIQTPQFHHPHHRPHFQRWQDLATLLPNLPGSDGAATVPHPYHPHPLHNYPHHPHHPHHHHHHHHHQNFIYEDIDKKEPIPLIREWEMIEFSENSLKILFAGGPNLVNAVATSMNLTNSSEPMGESSSAPHYKLEPSHDMVYYQVRCPIYFRSISRGR
ncbi:unnamed protein product [Phaedon cochleariae]|uniref:Uncharacterized protein n=1 Tax=Phaedon cochleariae TaxID=80249 RepID=A0A9N9SGU5_PHACE|nr:unnamed protein product [Phaedon cochleariae]